MKVPMLTPTCINTLFALTERSKPNYPLKLISRPCTRTLQTYFTNGINLNKSRRLSVTSE